MNYKSNKKTIKILAIESSCDETAASVVEISHPEFISGTHEKKILKQVQNDNLNIKILSNVISSQINLHKKYGGVYPELASREHIRNILPVINKSLNIAQTKNLKLKAQNYLKDIDYIAVTNGPGLIGSLLVGVNTAKTISYVFNNPLIPVNHLAGHIYANFIENNNFNKQSDRTISTSKVIEHLPKFPIVALVVSGGHTSLIYMKSHFDFKVIGETLDDAAGEAYDKVASMLGLKYPGGPVIDTIASKLQAKNYKLQAIFPRPMINSNNFDFSFSGLKTSVLYYLKGKKITAKLQEKVAYEFQEAVTDVLVAKTLRAAKKYHAKSIILGGGVAANSRLREKFDYKLSTINYKQRFFVPKKSLCTDNAAVIGVAAAYKIKYLLNNSYALEKQNKSLKQKQLKCYDIEAKSDLDLK